MRVLSGLIYHESNTFNPFLTGLDQFVVREGEEILPRFASTEVFQKAGAEIVPSIYATAFSSGPVAKDAYGSIKNRLLKSIEGEEHLDGIWLHLHGAMLIDEIGSAEVDILRDVRSLVGPDMPISVTLDPHGNLDPRVSELATVLRAYRTIPHTDQPEIERRTAEHLVKIMGGEQEGRAIGRSSVPIVISGDIPLSHENPLSDILKKLDEVEATPGIIDASYFVGFAWADVAQNGGTVTVVPESEQHAALAQELAEDVRDYALSRFPEFEFTTPTLEVSETVEAFNNIQCSPLVVSDSGDNTTGGGVGYSTVVLQEVLERGGSVPTCVSTIWAPSTAEVLAQHEVGSPVTVSIGMDHDDLSRPIHVEGVLKAKGDLLGYMSSEKDRIGTAYTVSVGKVDIVVTDQPGSFVTTNHFTAAGLSHEDYSVIIVKQGYMFPQISAFAGQHIMCISPGATYQFIENLKFENVDQERIFIADRTPL